MTIFAQRKFGLDLKLWLLIMIETRGLRSVAIPPLGSHNGGLEWLKVKLTPARSMLLLMFADMNRYGEFISVFAAEKLIYFMQRFGGKEFFKIDFQPYMYGPYSGGKVAHVLYYMNGSYIRGMGGMQSRPFDYLWLMEDAEKEALKFINNYKDETLYKICNNTMTFLGGYYSNYSLELLSSVDFILNNNSILKDWREKDESFVLDILAREMQKWSVRKGQLFKPEYLAKAFRYLKGYRNEIYL